MNIAYIEATCKVAVTTVNVPSLLLFKLTLHDKCAIQAI